MTLACRCPEPFSKASTTPEARALPGPLALGGGCIAGSSGSPGGPQRRPARGLGCLLRVWVLGPGRGLIAQVFQGTVQPRVTRGCQAALAEACRATARPPRGHRRALGPPDLSQPRSMARPPAFPRGNSGQPGSLSRESPSLSCVICLYATRMLERNISSELQK